MEAKRKLWFKRRRYGLGWTPVTWQGWTVVVVVVAIAALVVISTRKGTTPPRWR